MSCRPIFACYGSKVDDVSSLFSRVSLGANNTPPPLLGLRENGFVDPYRLGLVTDCSKYRQTYAIRSSDVGPNKTATLESILDLFQETKANQLRLTGLFADGFGTTPEMIRNNLIWVLAKMQVEVDNYPVWGDIIDIETWFVESKSLGIRRDWVVRSHNTDMVFARATSTWVMMNHKTRRLSKMSEAVKDELSPWFIDSQAIQPNNGKIEKLDADKSTYMNSNIKPKRSDLDMNNHVNNVNFLSWMLETIPDQFVETHQLSGVTLEYKRECKSSDVVQSLCSPCEDGILHNKDGEIKYMHLLQINGGTKSEEIVRGRTEWKRKPFAPPFPI